MAEDITTESAQTVAAGQLRAFIERVERLEEEKQTISEDIKEIFAEVASEVRPNAHAKKLEYMDLVAVRECTDARFLPPQYAQMSAEEVEARIETLRRFV